MMATKKAWSMQSRGEAYAVITQFSKKQLKKIHVQNRIHFISIRLQQGIIFHLQFAAGNLANEHDIHE
jgi:hypothetical protein